MGFGAILSWRQVSFICALFPICCLITIYFVIYDCSFSFYLIWRSCFMSNLFFNSSFRFSRRYPSRPTGSLQTIVQKMPKNHCNGFVDGCRRLPFTKNSLICENFAVYQMLVRIVRNDQLSVFIWRQRFGRKSKKFDENGMQNHLFCVLVYIFCFNLVWLLFGNRT